MKPFLILQARPETDASDQEYAAILDKCGLPESRAHRIRLDCEDVPKDMDFQRCLGRRQFRHELLQARQIPGFLLRVVLPLDVG